MPNAFYKTTLEKTKLRYQINVAVADQGLLALKDLPLSGVFPPQITRKLVALKEGIFMRHFDFSPLYRSTVGFDRLFTMLDSLGQPESAQAYPPYNIESIGESTYRITMAVAGFDQNEIEIEAHRNQLTVKGTKITEENEAEKQFLYRGIASRAFERRFHLADHMEVAGASLKNGLLHIELKREVPEELKPRKIAVSAVANGTAQSIDTKALDSK